MPDKPYHRHHIAVCNGDAALGTFMQHLSRFLAGTMSPACFTDDGDVQREGIARTWEQWAEKLGVSLKQFRRVLEKAQALGYIVRARRAWGKYRAIRLHVAITSAYVDELAKCVALGPTAYRKAIKTAHQHPIANAEGQYHIAHLGKTTLPTEGKTMLPTEGNYIEDSSHTQTLSKTALTANAEAQPSPYGQVSPGEEKTMTLSPHSPPSPVNTINFGDAGIAVTTTWVDLFEELSVAGEENAHTPTVTSQGLANKLRALGLLAEWQRMCVACGLPPAENVTDEQLIALSWWCDHSGDLDGPSEQYIAHIIIGWDEYATALCAADDAQHLKPTEKPDLDFVRQVVDILRASEAGHGKHSQVDILPGFVQSIA